MSKPVLLGILASLFFSSTFVLNRSMAVEGGHWVWSAALRYLFMIPMLGLWIAYQHGLSALSTVFSLYRRHFFFWMVAGGIGFGVFYTFLCYASAFAPGWIIACTWQCTTLATPLVLLFFGKRVPTKGLLLLVLIAFGAILANAERASAVSIHVIVWAVVPILIAAVGYPLGNQAVKEATDGTTRWIRHIDDPLMNIATVRVLLMAMGTLPLWIILIVSIRPPTPTEGQILQTILVALCSGVIATSIFYKARSQASSAGAIAAVDATQAGETVFSLLGEVLFLGITLPGPMGIIGLLLICIGLVLYARMQAK